MPSTPPSASAPTLPANLPSAIPPAIPPASPAAPPAVAIGTALAALAIALLMGLQALTTDLYLPALPLLKRELGAGMAGAQMTMSALLLAFGFGQLVWGPLSDRYGRRPVLLAGLWAYVGASLLAAAAGSIGQLVLLRVAQGLAMAATVVVARAMVRDLYEPAQGAQVMARALSGLGLIAIVSPVLGGLVTHFIGWRSAFLTVACGGAATLALVVWRLPETLPPARRRQPWRGASATIGGRSTHPLRVHLRDLARGWAEVLRHPGFRAWALLTCCSYGGLFTFLAASSFVYISVLGLGPLAYGAVMASCSLSYFVGTLVCRRRLARLGTTGAVQQAAGLSVAAALAFAGLAALGVQTLWAVWLPQLVYQFAHGTHMPCSQAGAVAPFPQRAGVASSLSGFATALVAFAIGLALGRLLDDSTRVLAWGLALAGLLTGLVSWTLVRRHGTPATRSAAAAHGAS